MQLVFFNDFTPGVLVQGSVIDISSLLGEAGPVGPQALLQHLITDYERLRPRIAALCQERQGIPVDSVRLRAPVPQPVHLLCAIRNYRDAMARPEADFFLKAPGSIVGSGDTIVLPDAPAKKFDHEAELAVVIGRAARHVPASAAMDYVFGYTGFIDASARGLGNSFYLKKSFDTFGPMGPALVTADEIPDPHNLHVRLWGNDQLRQDYSTSEMANRIERLIELASSVHTLLPGDVIATGTHHVGLGPMQDGDRLTLEIERIGRISVNVVDPLHRTWETSA